MRPASGASTIGATRRRRASCSSCPTGRAIAESLLTARIIYFSGITLSLYSNTGLGRFLAVLEMARQKGVKVAFDGNYRAARLEGRRRAHPHGVHGGAQARRSRAADLRRRGGAVGRCQPGRHGRPPAGVRRRRNRGEERPQRRAGRRQERPRARAGAGGGRCRSTRRPPATASMPPIWRPACAATTPLDAVAKAHRVAAEKIRHRGAIMPRAAAAMH